MKKDCIEFSKQEILTFYKKTEDYKRLDKKYTHKIDKQVLTGEGFTPSFYSSLARKQNIKDFFGVSPKCNGNIAMSCVVHIPDTFNRGYYLHFDGEKINSLAKINTQTAKILTNGQIMKGNLKKNKKDMKLLNEFSNVYNKFGNGLCSIKKSLK